MVAQTASYDRDTCHLCGCALQCHPEYNNECPWFEHTETGLTSNGRQHCPYTNPDASEQQLVRRLQASSPMPLPGSVKPTGNAHNARAVTMVNVTA
ncbi:DUF7828 domain-containing protein [Citrobacter freundii]|uniref:DUF7828 domain-containing protein n=1 Tax=Citrobacter freundii TaxID=546 RepID=UPI00387E0E9D